MNINNQTIRDLYNQYLLNNFDALEQTYPRAFSSMRTLGGPEMSGYILYTHYRDMLSNFNPNRISPMEYYYIMDTARTIPNINPITLRAELSRRLVGRLEEKEEPEEEELKQRPRSEEKEAVRAVSGGRPLYILPESPPPSPTSPLERRATNRGGSGQARGGTGGAGRRRRP